MLLWFVVVVMRSVFVLSLSLHLVGVADCSDVVCCVICIATRVDVVSTVVFS